MYKIIQRNQKKLLAIFGSILMVIFIIPPAAKQSMRSSKQTIGYFGEAPIYNTERAQSDADVAFLEQAVTFDPMRNQPVPFIMRLGQTVKMAIDEHRELYLMLQHEADRQGIQVSEDELGTVLRNEVFFRGQPITPEMPGYDIAYQAMRRYLRVQTLFDRVAGDVKVTQPMWDHAAASRFQLVRLTLAEFRGDDFKKKVAAPTTQQAQDQYDKYKNINPDKDRLPEDPLGFGYQYADRLKIQYLSIPNKQVIEAAKATRKPYDWDVAARKYYYQHESEFVRVPPPQTQPATQASTQASTQPTTESTTQSTVLAATAPTSQSAASTQPSTRPYSEVQAEVMDKVLRQPAEDLMQKIQEAISARLNADYKQANSGSQAASQPNGASAAFQAIWPKEYLDQVALDIQKQFNVLPTVVQTGDWKTMIGLETIPNLSRATVIGHSDVSVAQYAMATTPISAEVKGGPELAPLEIYQPSLPLVDASKDVYIFRVTARQPAHAPDLNDIVDNVKSDYVTQQAFDLARKAAIDLLAPARKESVYTAARAAERRVFTTVPFSPLRGGAGLQLDPASQVELNRQAGVLLSQASIAEPHPVGLIELPGAQKVYVAQLAEVSPAVPSSAQSMYRLSFDQMQAYQLREKLLGDYFSYDATKARVQYRSTDTSGS